jgi:hypothetical protein
LKVNYESRVDWRQATDNLHCNPQFFGHKREDCVIIQADDDKPLFAQLLFIIKCFIAGKEYAVALVHKFDQAIVATSKCPQKDLDLGLLRVRARPQKLADFIFVESIIRGALIVEDYGSEYGDDRFVVDTLDSDMFIRLRGMHKGP